MAYRGVTRELFPKNDLPPAEQLSLVRVLLVQEHTFPPANPNQHLNHYWRRPAVLVPAGHFLIIRWAVRSSADKREARICTSFAARERDVRRERLGFVI